MCKYCIIEFFLYFKAPSYSLFECSLMFRGSIWKIPILEFCCNCYMTEWKRYEECVTITRKRNARIVSRLTIKKFEVCFRNHISVIRNRFGNWYTYFECLGFKTVGSMNRVIPEVYRFLLIRAFSNFASTATDCCNLQLNWQRTYLLVAWNPESRLSAPGIEPRPPAHMREHASEWPTT